MNRRDRRAYSARLRHIYYLEVSQRGRWIKPMFQRTCRHNKGQIDGIGFCIHCAALTKFLGWRYPATVELVEIYEKRLGVKKVFT